MSQFEFTQTNTPTCLETGEIIATKYYCETEYAPGVYARGTCEFPSLQAAEYVAKTFGRKGACRVAKVEVVIGNILTDETPENEEAPESEFQDEAYDDLEQV